MAFCNSLIVTSIGTIVPSRIHVRIRSPYCECSRFCSARSRSPADQRIKSSPSGTCNPFTHQKGGKNQSLSPEERTASLFLKQEKVFPFPRVAISLNDIPDPGPPRTKTTVTSLLSNFGECFLFISWMLTTCEDEISVVICRGIREVSMGSVVRFCAFKANTAQTNFSAWTPNIHTVPIFTLYGYVLSMMDVTLSLLAETMARIFS